MLLAKTLNTSHYWNKMYIVKLSLFGLFPSSKENFAGFFCFVAERSYCRMACFEFRQWTLNRWPVWSGYDGRSLLLRVCKLGLLSATDTLSPNLLRSVAWRDSHPIRRKREYDWCDSITLSGIGDFYSAIFLCYNVFLRLSFATWE